MTSAEIRQAYIDFFVQKHGHTFVPSSPVVPHDDPTLLFTNAGMNQFKPIFLGQEKRAYTRAVNTQKCIRAGGKHNDLDDVGRSRRHHTFFEMLGNWSFGDYFKQGAIEMVWELLTKVWKLDPERLHVSCFEGDEKNGVPRDTEAADIWKKVAGLPDDHIHFFGKDKFWEMGDTGPCGPCTEIYYDRTPDKSGGPQVNGEDPRVMEIWNNVFIQYNRNADRSLTVLPAQHVDTGMGFERICQVLQDKGSNYDIDLWDPFWTKLKELSGHTYGGKFPKTNAADPVAEAADEGLRKDIAFRVIADHVRCLTFAITDGASPSNEGRGYVLRRILRRAVRFGRQQLGLRDPFMHELVSVVVSAMGAAFPELKKSSGHVIGLIRDEEVSFGKTIDRGIALFDDAVDRAVERQQKGISKSIQISGEDAFKLHDTYGFPVDLTRIMAEERGFSIDAPEYERLMEEAREKARAGGKEGDTSLATLPPDALGKLETLKIAPTDDQPKYKREQASAQVVAIWDGTSFTDHIAADAGDSFAVVLSRTPFYAEMGGQVGDVGTLTSSRGGEFEVHATKAAGKYVLHLGQRKSGDLKVGDAVTAVVDDIRDRTQQNHTTTHLANWALRETLGDGVQQKGSLVDPEKLRLDFSHGKALADDELAKIESLVNETIEKALPVYAENAPQEQALKIAGLRAVFGEKYPPLVRVVSVGVPVKDLLENPTNPEWRAYSVEFCGGTHLQSSEQAESFVIVAEESVSKGIRRIVAHTGAAAKDVLSANEAIEKLLSAGAGTPEAELPILIAEIQKTLGSSPVGLRVKRKAQAAIGELQAKFKAHEKSTKQSSAGTVDVSAVSGALVSGATDAGGGKLIVGEVHGASADQLLAVFDSIKKRGGSYGLLLGSAADGKVNFIAAVSDDLIAKGLKAGDWIRETAKVAGGGGGGRPQMAQAGGKDPAKLGEALATAKAFANGILTK